MACCSKCNAEESENETYSQAKCDFCDISLCINCSTLSASEHKGVTVKKRSPCIKFTCKECLLTKTSEASTKSILADIKNSMVKVLQKGFEELNAKTNKIDKLSKSMEFTNKSVSTVKNDSVAIMSKMEDITTAFNDLTSTNKEVIHLYAGSKGQTRSTEQKEILAIQKDLQELKDKCKRQEQEIHKLKDKINSLTSKDLTSSENQSCLLSDLTQAPKVQTANNQIPKKIDQRENKGKICSGPGKANIKVANPNIGERLAKLSWIYISNIHVATTSEHIIEALDPTHKHLYKCEKLQSKYKNPKSVSFKLGVPENLEAEYMSPDFWPDGAYIAKYHIPGYNQHGRNNSEQNRPNFQWGQHNRYRRS